VYGAFALVMGLLCIAVIILISAWRYRHQQMLMRAIARRHSGRRIICTYPQLQVRAGVVPQPHATVTLPPPYNEAIAMPPPYSSVDIEQPASPDVQLSPTSVTLIKVDSVHQSAHESNSLLNHQL